MIRGGYLLAVACLFAGCGPTKAATTLTGGDASVDANDGGLDDKPSLKDTSVAPKCDGGGRTTVTGTILDPASKIPLYNVAVYVPSKPVEDFVGGPSCDPCDSVTGTSISPAELIALATTDVTGRFTLGAASGIGDVPSGSNIPLVIQLGKWRRQINIPHVEACQNTDLTDTDLTRLPRTQAEGHIPKIALTTGGQDALECLLRKVGIDDSEFTPETGPGRINFYAGGGGAFSYDRLNNAASFTPAHPWWDSLDNLKKYDIVLHACEGSFGSYSADFPPLSEKSPQAMRALQDFADMGGRVFASHYHAYWFEKGSPAFQSIATFTHRAGGLPNPYDATIDQAFTAGRALSEWMVKVGGSTTPGTVSIAQTAATRLIEAAAGGNISQRWVYASTLEPPSVQYLSANTPIPGGRCGRVVLSDFHVSSSSADGDQPAMPFPVGCVTTDLSPQEKILEFMLFDLGSCVAPQMP